MPTATLRRVVETERRHVRELRERHTALTDAPSLPDPLAFAHRCQFEPDPWQADLLQCQAQQIILNCSRQSGKSSTTAVLGLYEALSQPQSLILLLSPSLRQSSELFRKVRDALSHYDPSGITIVQESVLRLELTNGSRIISLPGAENTVRGYSGVRLLLVDEAAFVDDALYQAVRPMLAVSRGRLILLSSPFGKRGFFYHEWSEGGPHWHRIRVTAYDCPRIPRDWLEQERRSLPPAVFASEYLAEFTDVLNAVFPHDAVMAAMSDELEPLGLFGGAA